MASIKRVGIVIKQRVTEANELALQAAVYLKKKKISAIFAAESKDVCDQALGVVCANKPDLIKKSDLIMVLGGDGTFVSVARLMEKRCIPILGINMGQLGFLTEFRKTEMIDGLSAAIRGRLPISERTMLECSLVRKGKVIHSGPVVNDVVVSKGAIARIFDMEVSVDGKLVTNIKADGLIISTPTGSTAYNLAAGGPIVEPSVPAIVMAPICAHSLTLRPLVFSHESKVTIAPRYKSGTVVLTLDGQVSFDLRPNDVIKVTRFKKHPLQIYSWPKRDYYSLLREKLKYGYRD